MNKLAIALSLYFLLLVGVYVIQPLGENNNYLEQSLFVGISFLATLSGFFALMTYGKGSRSTSLLLLSFGLLSWFIADSIYFYLDFIVGKLTFPSTNDYFYLIGYTLLFAGIMWELRSVDIKWKKLNKRVLFAVSSFAVLMLGVFSYITYSHSYDPAAPLGMNMVTIGYTVGDLLLVIGSFFAIVMAWEYRGGRASVVWGALFLGFLTTMIADFIFAVYPEGYLVHGGFIYSLSQYFYNLGYLFIIYALLSLRDTLQLFRQMLKEAWEREM